ncbi:MAG: nitroreductase family protein [Rickettsiales bacterium]|jgi:nitroreductase|nr:nitroreductase family protein [Rickettsiales bacterium]
MEFIELIHTRRSTRKYNSQVVSDEVLNIVLAAGMTAPSAMNKQPWEFIIVKDAQQKEAVAKISQYAQMTLESPVSILVCGNTEKSFSSNYLFDCAAASQNILLSATALGLGSVWTGIDHKNEELKDSFKKIFNLPKHIEPVAYLVLGYTDNVFTKKNYFDENKVHLNKW